MLHDYDDGPGLQYLLSGGVRRDFRREDKGRDSNLERLRSERAFEDHAVGARRSVALLQLFGVHARRKEYHYGVDRWQDQGFYSAVWPTHVPHKRRSSRTGQLNCIHDQWCLNVEPLRKSGATGRLMPQSVH